MTRTTTFKAQTGPWLRIPTMGLSLGLLAMACASGEGDGNSGGGMLPNLGGVAPRDSADGDAPEGGDASGATGDPSEGGGGAPGDDGGQYPEVGGLDRGPGMPIGTGAAGPDDGSGSDPEVDPSETDGPTGTEQDEPLEIPVFEVPEADSPPPCSGCVELSVVVDDINQTNEFSFNPGGITGVTRVVWTVILPFNSDQLFIRSVINNGDGPYTFMSANGFTINTPTELIHETGGTINSAGIKMGSAGAWTGNQPVVVFVDSVRFEGPNTTITFDASAEGMTPRTTQRQPQVIFHP